MVSFAPRGPFVVEIEIDLVCGDEDFIQRSISTSRRFARPIGGAKINKGEKSFDAAVAWRHLAVRERHQRPREPRGEAAAPHAARGRARAAPGEVHLRHAPRRI